MTYNLGQAVTLSTAVTDASGAPTDATVVLTVTKPDGTTLTPSVTHDGSTGSGLYEATFTVDQVATWFWRWDATGAILDNGRGQIDVADPKAPTYATLAELKKRLNIANTTYDDELQDALESASRDVDDDTGHRQFWLQQTPTQRLFTPSGRVEDTAEGQRILVDDIGSINGLVVEVGAASTFTTFLPEAYALGPDNALARGRPYVWVLRYYTPWTYFPTQRVRITAQWGWPTIPAKIKQATLIRAQRLYRRKDSPEAVAGFNDLGVVRLGRYDPDYDKLISSFMTYGFGG